ncbi:EF-P beta-lysylation protein EpmB [Thiomicrorhabdus heinhorstiae]|uniref:L-lysine 2,3-aminomutase n=1 Tax=Thiomicrorhabdus heinhorstiae TaxID=2748010 RepID=A0ABS0BXA3_9GAMM|nr:EF-P beta-lysylation protein EpmB [Thiomicrorhabdus heinhorstiae]MBF6058423.1 EF-P beta-lysylation protein EpmB [Thiomicrorhabdus heinhorstiae]
MTLDSAAVLDTDTLRKQPDYGFAFKAPQAFLQRINPNDPKDPLLLQIRPDPQEGQEVAGFKTDPVGDLHKNPIPSLLHKYHGRVLLMASPRCDLHCRYCFRRHFPYQEQINRRHWQEALDYIRRDDSIHEVILSGGDPLTLNPEALLQLLAEIEQIPQVKTLRFHSRTPIAIPEKPVHRSIIQWAEKTRLNAVMVIHCNHPQELNQETAALFTAYRQSGIHLLNQSVLLKQINDSIEALEALSHKLFSQGVLPYYLHQLDRVSGSAHFEVNQATAQALHTSLRERLPGYLLPKLVQEISGEPYKTPL